MTEETFNKEVNQLHFELTNEDRERFANEFPDIMDAIIYIRGVAEAGDNLDDWECWLGNVLFKGV